MDDIDFKEVDEAWAENWESTMPAPIYLSELEGIEEKTVEFQSKFGVETVQDPKAIAKAVKWLEKNCESDELVKLLLADVFLPHDVTGRIYDAYVEAKNKQEGREKAKEGSEGTNVEEKAVEANLRGSEGARKNTELDRLVQDAVYGYQINIMDLSKVRKVAEEAYAKGQDVKEAVHALLDQIAVKTASKKVALLSEVRDGLKKVADSLGSEHDTKLDSKTAHLYGIKSIKFQIEENGDLVISVSDPNELQEIKDLVASKKFSNTDLYDVFEHITSNGLDWVDPEEIGAMTEAPILTDSRTESNVTDGIVWWYPNYEIRSPLEDLAETGKTVFKQEVSDDFPVADKTVMPRKKEIDVYTYDELSDKAKERVRQKLYADISIEYMEEGWKEDIEAKGFTDVEVRYSLGYSQGDGASFTATVDIPKFLEVNGLADKYGAIAHLIYKAVIKGTTAFHYVHKHSVDIEIDLEDSESPEEEAKLQQLIPLLEGDIKAVHDELADKIEEDGYAEIEYQSSEEYVKELSSAEKFIVTVLFLVSDWDTDVDDMVDDIMEQQAYGSGAQVTPNGYRDRSYVYPNLQQARSHASKIKSVLPKCKVEITKQDSQGHYLEVEAELGMYDRDQEAPNQTGDFDEDSVHKPGVGFSDPEKEPIGNPDKFTSNPVYRINPVTKRVEDDSQ